MKVTMKRPNCKTKGWKWASKLVQKYSRWRWMEGTRKGLCPEVDQRRLKKKKKFLLDLFNFNLAR